MSIFDSEGPLPDDNEFHSPIMAHYVDFNRIGMGIYRGSECDGQGSVVSRIVDVDNGEEITVPETFIGED